MDTLLNELLKNGILDKTVICKIEAMENQEYLKMHRYKIYQNKEGRWVTYLPGRKRIQRKDRAALETDSDIYKYLIKGVTEGLSYGCLRADGLVCSKDHYYRQYRHFFSCLNEIRK